VALFSGIDQGLGSDRVKLMTVHAAKGLEFPHVFIAALNEGVFPSRKVRTREGMEEERRLAFVAMTRAERGLYLVDAEGTTLEGVPRYPSRFVLDVKPSLLEYDEPLPDSLVAEARDYIALRDRKMDKDAAAQAAPRFGVGDRVRHRVFGLGTVRLVDAERAAYQIQFDELGTIRTITFRVPMEKVASEG
jgi:DNA helicase-2/ATP-dependent DNA helicase PcrA